MVKIEKNKLLTELALRTSKHRHKWTKERQEAFCEVVSRSGNLGQSVVHHVDNVVRSAIAAQRAGRLPQYEAWALGLMDIAPEGRVLATERLKERSVPVTGRRPSKAKGQA